MKLLENLNNDYELIFHNKELICKTHRENGVKLKI